MNQIANGGNKDYGEIAMAQDKRMPQCFSSFLCSFYIPKFKYQLVDALIRLYPNDKSFISKSKKQLYAIYFKVRWNIYESGNRETKSEMFLPALP